MAERTQEVPNKPAFVALFSAAWSPPSKQMEVVFDKLASKYSQLHFVVFDADTSPSLASRFEVSAVPYFLFFKNGKVVDRLEGASAPKVVQKVDEFSKKAIEIAQGEGEGPSSSSPSKIELESRLKSLINRAPVMLFMKGSPDAAKCKFSRKTVDLLKEEGIQFSSFDILNDLDVRQGLKEYSNWPTYPQLYIKGKLIGGVDILVQLKEDDELQELVAAAQPKTLEQRLKELISKSSVMLFMKGSPDLPKCGFSSKMVELLRQNKIEFGSFDILTDNEVREGLKKFSNWPTYPQVYANGKLVGGLDVLKELEEEGELAEAFGKE
eukprot:CAMPEP_0201489840 /NCGR_PEP_ID=MMETSP0151_2-20130828/23919_1 /ASSEMBLY_ACC=CAM_ASM_000257 /TAXON_ID=200890 /ORGANISM="Paramoeba atlantica, Strain 621/1 / CCAP 1560/9" /LENGTH=323 /DNA_ID=CAMNT_0047875555 /DNA_START=3 /DNA_END=974 /DNA_ORIENTATION=+